MPLSFISAVAGRVIVFSDRRSVRAYSFQLCFVTRSISRVAEDDMFVVRRNMIWPFASCPDNIAYRDRCRFWWRGLRWWRNGRLGLRFGQIALLSLRGRDARIAG